MRIKACRHENAESSVQQMDSSFIDYFVMKLVKQMYLKFIQ